MNAKEGVLNKIREAAGLLSYDEAAASLGISRRTLERIVQHGDIVVQRPSPGRAWIAVAEVERYRAAHTDPGRTNVVAWRGRKLGGPGRNMADAGGTPNP